MRSIIRSISADVVNQYQSALFVNKTEKDVQRTSSEREQTSNLPPTPKSSVRSITDGSTTAIEKVAVKDNYCNIASRGI